MMRGEIIWLSLIIGAAVSSPYYYRESKHQSEHHKEYSTSGVGEGEAPVDGSSSLDLIGKPERYSLPATGYSSSSGSGYSFSHGSGSSYQSSLPSPQTSRFEVPASSPVVVTRRVVKVISYPSTQTGYYQASGSQVHGSGSYLSPTAHSFGQREESLYGQGQKEESLDAFGSHSKEEFGQQPFSESVQTGQKVERHYQSSGSLHFGHEDLGQKPVDDYGFGKHSTTDKLVIGQREVDEEFGQQPFADSFETGKLVAGQKEIHEEFGQKPYSDSFETGQKVERHYQSSGSLLIGRGDSGQQPVDDYGFGKHSKTDKLVIGQREVPEEFGQQPYSDSLETGQKVERHYQSSGSLLIGHGDSGQQPVDDYGFGRERENDKLVAGQREIQEEFGQKPYTDSFETGQKVERHYQSSGALLIGRGDSGQQPVDDYGFGREIKIDKLEAGQKEIQEEFGQKPYTDSFETGQKVERHYQSSGSLLIGHGNSGQQPVEDYGLGIPKNQKESQRTVTRQREESLYQQPKVVHFEHPTQSTHIESYHKREESLYQKPRKDSIEDIGQREELSTGQQSLDLGQTEEEGSIYPGKYSGLETGQREEPLEVGQKEEPTPYHSKYTKEESTHREEVYSGSHGRGRPGSGLIVGQKEEVGQREESLYPKPEVGSLEGINKHVEKKSTYQSHSLEVGQKEVKEDISKDAVKDSLYGTSKYSPKEVQTESLYSPVYKPQVGQQVVKETSYHSMKYSSQEGGQKVEDGQKEEEGFHHGGYSSLEIGQKEEFPEAYESGQKEEKIDFNNGKYGSLEFGKEKQYDKTKVINQKSEKESSLTFSQRGESQFEPPRRAGSELVIGPPAQSYGTYKHKVYSWNMGKPCAFCKEASGTSGQLKQVHEEQRPSSVISTTQYGGDVSKPIGSFSSSTWAKNYTTVETQQSVPISNPKVSSTTQSHVMTVLKEYNRKPTTGTGSDLNQKVEELALLLGTDGISKKPDIPSTQVTQTLVLTSSTPAQVHKAEIQELGLENFKSSSQESFSQQPFVFSESPSQKVKAFETHREEYGYEYPFSKKAYSKKTSRKYSMREESEGREGFQSATGELRELRTPGQVSGGWYSVSSSQGSSLDGGERLESVQKRDLYQSGSDRHAQIDSFLSELDRDIARDTKKQPGSGGGSFTRVSTQEQAPSGYGTSYYSQSSSSHSMSSGTSSATGGGGSGSSSSSWYKRIGENIGSAYNRAKERLGETYNQAKSKAKEVVSSMS